MCHYSYIWHPKLLDIPHLNLFAKDLISRRSEADRAERTRNGWEIKGENVVHERKKREGGKRWEKESVFPEKKSSRERSRLGLPSWRNTRSSLILSFSLFSSAQLPTSSQLRTFTASAFQLVFLFLLFFFLFSLSLSLSFSLASSCVRVEGKLSLPWFLLVNTSALLTTNNFHLWYAPLFVVSHEYINYLLTSLRMFTRAWTIMLHSAKISYLRFFKRTNRIIPFFSTFPFTI